MVSDKKTSSAIEEDKPDFVVRCRRLVQWAQEQDVIVN